MQIGCHRAVVPGLCNNVHKFTSDISNFYVMCYCSDMAT